MRPRMSPLDWRAALHGGRSLAAQCADAFVPGRGTLLHVTGPIGTGARTLVVGLAEVVGAGEVMALEAVVARPEAVCTWVRDAGQPVVVALDEWVPALRCPPLEAALPAVLDAVRAAGGLLAVASQAHSPGGASVVAVAPTRGEVSLVPRADWPPTWWERTIGPALGLRPPPAPWEAPVVRWVEGGAVSGTAE